MNKISDSFKKVVIWGHPLHSHTHSYVHEGYYRAFKHCGYETYWFPDAGFMPDLDFSDVLFITEGFADKNIPLNDSSCYFVWYCPDPAKYISAGVKRFIEARMPCNNHKDHIHNYSLKDIDTIPVGPSCHFQRKGNGKINVTNDHVSYDIEDYDKVYINWATNLLPHEIHEADIYLQRDEKTIHFFGSISHPPGLHENITNFSPFIQECANNGVQFLWNDPWKTPAPTEVMISKVKESLLGIDVRGKEHIRTDVVPCRPFKNISYGHLGLTNSEAVRKELDGNCVFNPDTAALFYDGLENRKNWKMIKAGQELVKENHTYVNRVESLLRIVKGEY